MFWVQDEELVKNQPYEQTVSQVSTPGDIESLFRAISVESIAPNPHVRKGTAWTKPNVYTVLRHGFGT
jgi:hypothetical protein